MEDFENISFKVYKLTLVSDTVYQCLQLW
jgi:hypothetical protein